MAGTPLVPTATARRIRDEQKEFWEKSQAHRRRPEHPVIRAICEPRARYARNLVPDLTNPSVLDVGCGIGVMTHYLRDCFRRVEAVDFSEAMLRELPGRTGICGDAARLPFADASFDVVVSSHLLHHMPPDARLRAAREFARVARRWVLFYEPNRNNPAMLLFGLLKKTERMSVRFSRAYMVRLARSAGLDVRESRAECTILPNKTPTSLLGVARALNRRPLSSLGFYTRVTAHPIQ